MTVRLCIARLLAAAAGLLPLFAGAPPALAQGKLDARYVASVAGVPVGRGTWIVDISGDHFTAAASGRTTGVLSVLSVGEGSAASRGTISAGQPHPTSYAVTVTADERSDEVRIRLSGGSVKDFAVDPPMPPAPDRIPLTEAHRRGVIDPMTAGLLAVTGNGSTLVPEVCQRRLSIFDGRQRYDLELSYKRMDTVKAARGYQGPVVVCAVNYRPLAGHRPDRPAIRYLVAQRDMEMWLAPIPGTRVLVPFRISVPTPIGLAVLEATQFVAHAPRTGNAKTQGLNAQ